MKTIDIPLWVWDLFAIIGISVTLLVFMGLILYVFGRKRMKHLDEALEGINNSNQELTGLVDTFKGKEDNNGSS